MKSIQRFLVTVIVAFVIAGLAIGVMLWTFHEMEDVAQARLRTDLVIASASNLQSKITDAETGQRGYLLTGDEAFLAPYNAVRDGVAGNLTELRKLTSNPASLAKIDLVEPFITDKMAELAGVIELRRANNLKAAIDRVRGGHGMVLMDAIRAEISALIIAENTTRSQNESGFELKLQQLFTLIILASLFVLLSAISFSYLYFRQTKQRFKNTLHLETKHLLEIQEAMNYQLQTVNNTLQESETKLKVTLNSIGDAVITTDAEARVILLNPVAQSLTGWTQEEAVGKSIDEVFHIVNQTSRELATIPVLATLEHGVIQGLANHTVLIARDGTECDIADSCAPIRDHDGTVIGAILVFRNVTEEYAAQRALRDSNILTKTILDTVMDGIITIHADSGRVETFNRAAGKMFGFSLAESEGLTIGSLIPEFSQFQALGTLQFYQASSEETAKGILREAVGRHRNGHMFPLEMAVSEMTLGGNRYFTGMLRDITARRMAEAALLRAGALQSAIFNSANFSSIATDAKGVIQIFNVGAEWMLGYSAQEVINQITPADISDPLEVILRAKDLSLELGTPITPGFEALVYKASRGIEDIYELTYIRKDGSRFPAMVSVTALRDAENGIIGYLLIGTDNTARKLVEAERGLMDQLLLEKNAELEAARMVADKANLAKSEFLSSMSHELRSPLNAILGFAQLLETADPQPTLTQKKSIDQILKAGWYLLELINEILDLALIESGRLSLSLEPISLPQVMMECQAMIEPQALKRGISMVYPQYETAWFLRADRTRLKQVIINLLSNAIKYNRPQGSVVVGCAISGTVLRISVRDTGDGLSAYQLGQLFQPFNRLGREVNVEEGTGIGLVVCKRLVELMGGIIGVESEVGEGSLFWFELNLTDQLKSAAQTEEPSKVAQEYLARGQKPHTMLYVEDNPANLMLVEALVARRPDMRLISARDANSGIELARSFQPDIILMDINLPGISGIDALGILAEDPLTSHIPVVALSANAIPCDIEKGLAAGFFRYLTKPIKVDEFMATLNLALDLAKSRAAERATGAIL